MTKSTITREHATDKEIQMLIDSHENGTAMFMRTDAYYFMAKELQERRKADSEPVAWTWQHLKQWHVTNDEERARDLAWDGVKVDPLYRHAQPASVGNEFIPKNLDRALGVLGMALPESKEEFNLQSERWIQRLIDRVIRYADEFKAQPAPVVPESICVRQAISALERADAVTTIGQAYKLGWNACRAAMLQAEPVTTANKLGNSPVIPDCWCRTCRPVALNDMRFVVCPDCGNKRCPRANDHRNSCTWSNELGQEGSAYPAAPQEVKP